MSPHFMCTSATIGADIYVKKLGCVLNGRAVCRAASIVNPPSLTKSFVISITYQSTEGFVSANGLPIGCLFSLA